MKKPNPSRPPRQLLVNWHECVWCPPVNRPGVELLASHKRAKSPGIQFNIFQGIFADPITTKRPSTMNENSTSAHRRHGFTLV